MFDSVANFNFIINFDFIANFDFIVIVCYHYYSISNQPSKIFFHGSSDEFENYRNVEMIGDYQ